MLKKHTIKLARYFHTTRYLQFRQIYYRLYYACRRPRVVFPIKLKIRPWLSAWHAPLVLQSCLSARGDFSFLGKVGHLHDATIWNSSHHTKLWSYNLHYFDALSSVDAQLLHEIFEIYFDVWIDQNPPLVGNGWEPYPISLRVVNWIKWFSSEKAQPNARWIDSLSLQAEVLMQRLEFHILGNHLFANAKALVFLGSYFSGKRATAWLNEGIQILDREIREQFLVDGGHFELSPMYHCTLLWDMCDLVNLANTTTLQALTMRIMSWKTVIERGLAWLSRMVHPDGDISFFNDAAFGIAPKFADLQSYASQLNIVIEQDGNDFFDIKLLEQTGYCVVNLPNRCKAILDVAKIGPDYQPGHAHADILSFELSLYGQRCFVNSGTSHYGDDALRQFQRSTKAHNTVCIDDKNSSDVWAGFRVAQRTYPCDLSIKKELNCFVVGCAHAGPLRLPSSYLHRREWIFSAHGMTIHDVIKGGFVEAEAHFYLHPDVHNIKQEQHCISCSLPEGQQILIAFHGGSQVAIEPTNWYPFFGTSIKNNCLVVKLKGHALTTQVIW